MITVQPPSERTPMQKIAPRSESLSMCLLSDTVPTGVEISACDSLCIIRSVPAGCTVMGPVLMLGSAAGGPGAGATSPGRLTKYADLADRNRHRGREDRSHEDYHLPKHRGGSQR